MVIKKKVGTMDTLTLLKKSKTDPDTNGSEESGGKGTEGNEGGVDITE